LWQIEAQKNGRQKKKRDIIKIFALRGAVVQTRNFVGVLDFPS
jgi:hypothetical protein